MNKHFILAAAIGAALGLTSAGAQAKADAQDLARLGADLTPTGAEKAASADGSVPAWDGGLTKAPAGYDPAKGYADPFAGEKPLYTVTAANVAQYADKLTEGYQAMLKKYPDSYKLNVYPSHRTAALPAAEYAQIKREAGKVELAPDGNGLLNYEKTTVPFPVPKSAIEVIFNHKARYRAGGYECYPTEMVVQANGSFTPVRRVQRVVPATAIKDAEPNMLLYFTGRVVAPESLAGNVNLVHETLDQTKQPREAWTYNPGQRRVLRAPEFSYDTPNATSDGLETNDSFDMFSGATDRYDWKLVGKKELIVPYNEYKLADRSLKYGDIVKVNHLNPELMRYELHRVWVVEATLRPGQRHIYARRRFYVDEDSWQILTDEMFDGHGKFWRMQEAQPLQRYDVLTSIALGYTDYDIQTNRYEAYGLQNEEQPVKFGITATLDDFSPGALRRSGR